MGKVESEYDLKAIAEDLLTEYLNDDIDYSFVYESDYAEDLTEDEQIEVHRLMGSANISFVIGNKEEK